ncbi:chalcone isomerase family protein [Aquabacterium sp.]|uniref:chalcone isomerase family protein n=1 Tax=Aquabacterium sp. TaxID=1872578 RepID=UPI003D6CFD2D
MASRTALSERRQALRRLGSVGVGLAALNHAGGAWAAKARPDLPVPPEVAQNLAQARLQGDSRFRYYGFHVYDAQLWVPPGFDAGRVFSQPFALSLVYARSLKARDIAERSIDEMRRQVTLGDAEAQRWLQAMSMAFADVRSGDRLTGLHQVNVGASFFLNGQATRVIEDPRFATLFFGIWLSPATSAPALRRDLLGA